MTAVSLADIDQRQHHKDEGLQQNDQDVEKPPDQTCEDLSKTSTDSPKGTEFESETAKKRQQEEQQLTSIHVAEKSHTERDELSEILNEVQQEVERPESGMLAKRRSKQFCNETAEALHLHPVVEEEKQHTERHAKRTIQVSRRQRTEVRKTEPASNHWEQVNRDQVDGVHQRHPAKHS